MTSKLRPSFRRKTNDIRCSTLLLNGSVSPSNGCGPKRNSICSRSHLFEKHFFEQVGDLKSEGEEFDCAMFIDGLPEVEFWIRNLERSNTSFWLPTSTDRFYPDFVAKLKDGRLLVVEYKGADRLSNDDSREKRRIGELWEAKSGGTCLFVMSEGTDLEAIRRKILVSTAGA